MEKTSHSAATTSHNIIQANLESKLTEIFCQTSSGTATPAHPPANHAHVAHPPSSLASQLNAQLSAAVKDSSHPTSGQLSQQSQAAATPSSTVAPTSEVSPGGKSRPGSYGAEEAANSLLLLKQAAAVGSAGQTSSSATESKTNVSTVASVGAANSAATYATAAAAAVSTPIVSTGSTISATVPSVSSTLPSLSTVISEQSTASTTAQPIKTVVPLNPTSLNLAPSTSDDADNLGRRQSRFSVTPVAEPSNQLHEIAGQVTAETLTTPTTTTTNSFPDNTNCGNAASVSVTNETLPKVVSSTELMPPPSDSQQPRRLSRFTVTPCTNLVVESQIVEQAGLLASNLVDSYSQTSPIMLKVRVSREVTRFQSFF